MSGGVAELTESQYARLHLNQWRSPEDRLTTVDDIQACVTLDGPQDAERGGSYAVGLDLGLVNDRTVLTVAHAERREEASSGLRVVLDRQFVWQGSRAVPVSLDAVEAVCREVHRQYGRPHFVADPYQATQLCQRLRDRGYSVEEYAFTTTSVSRLVQRLYLLLRDRALALPPDEELLDELANVRLRETSPAIYRMDHDPGRHDDRAVSLALAANWLAEKGLPSGRMRFGGVRTMGHRRIDDLPIRGLTV